MCGGTNIHDAFRAPAERFAYGHGNMWAPIYYGHGLKGETSKVLRTIGPSNVATKTRCWVTGPTASTARGSNIILEPSPSLWEIKGTTGRREEPERRCTKLEKVFVFTQAKSTSVDL